MTFLIDAAKDALIEYVTSRADALWICSAEPATLTEAVSTYALGSKTSPSWGSVGDATPNGRKATCAAITDGSITATGTASHYAHVDTGTALLMAAALSATKSVNSGDTFSLTAHDLTVPDPT